MEQQHQRPEYLPCTLDILEPIGGIADAATASEARISAMHPGYLEQGILAYCCQLL